MIDARFCGRLAVLLSLSMTCILAPTTVLCESGSEMAAQGNDSIEDIMELPPSPADALMAEDEPKQESASESMNGVPANPELSKPEDADAIVVANEEDLLDASVLEDDVSHVTDNGELSQDVTTIGVTENDDDWHQCGTCEWTIDSSDTLIIRPSDGTDGTLGELEYEIRDLVSDDDWDGVSEQVLYHYYYTPWQPEGSRIRCVRVEGTVRANTCKGLFYGCSSLTSLDLTGLDTSGVTDMSEMFSGCSSIDTLSFSNLDTSHVMNMFGMFAGCSSLASLDLTGLDTSGVADMNSMFSGCSSLTLLDLTGLDTSGVADMNSMFSGCSSLTSLDVSGLDTSMVEVMESMFSGCSSLTSLDLSGLDTSMVEDMDNMFADCSSLPSLDLSGLDTSGVVGMHGIFSGCLSLTSLDLSNWDTSNAKGISDMFKGCASLVSVYLPGVDVSSYGRFDLRSMFSGCTSLQTLSLPRWKLGIDMPKFSCFGTLRTIDLSGWDTSNVTQMIDVFENCSSLESLDLSGWDMTSVSFMSGVFQNCSSLESLDLSNWDMSGATNMYQLFQNCLALSQLKVNAGFAFSPNCPLPSGLWMATSSKKVYDAAEMPNHVADTYVLVASERTCSDWTPCGTCAWRIDQAGTLIVRPANGIEGTLAGWRGSYYENYKYCYEYAPWHSRNEEIRAVRIEGKVHATTCLSMFTECSSLETANLSGLDTSGVTDMSYMFSYCDRLKKLDLSSLNTCNVTNLDSMFLACRSLSMLNVSGWDTSNVRSMNGVFRSCSSLVSLDVAGWDTSQVIDMAYIFDGCGTLISLDVSAWNTSQVTDMANAFSGCVSLTRLDVSHWNTPKLTSMNHLFMNCSSVTSLDLSSWDTSSVEYNGMIWVFMNCGSLSRIKLGSLFSFCGASSSKQCVLPGDYWLAASNGKEYKWNMIPDNVADTYYLRFGSLSDAEGILSATNYTYNGTSRLPAVTVRLDGKTLKRDTDYSVTYASGRINPGTYRVVVKGKGHYSGSLTKTFDIDKIDNQITAKAVKASVGVTYKQDDATTTAKNVAYANAKGTVTYVNDSANDSALRFIVNKQTGEVTIPRATKAGTYAIRITIEDAGTTYYCSSAATVTYKVIVGKAASKVSIAAQTKAYTGKAIAYTGKLTKSGSAGKVTYKYFSNASCTEAVKVENVKNAGIYYVKAILAADANHKSVVSAAVKLTISKAKNPLELKVAKRKAKLAQVKKKSLVIACPIVVSKAKGRLSYSKVAKGSSAALTINKSTGKVTVKKGTKKGTYKIKIKVSAAGDANYKAAGKTLICKIVVG